MMRMNFPMVCMVVFFFAFGLALNAQSENPNSGSWSGVIINANCTADEAFAEAPKCTEKDVPGAQAGIVRRHHQADLRPRSPGSSDWSSGGQHDAYWNT